MMPSVSSAPDKHPDQQLGIDRGPTDVAVERTQLFVQVAEAIQGALTHSKKEMSLRYIRRGHGGADIGMR
jgi:hypothetical protein